MERQGLRLFEFLIDGTSGSRFISKLGFSSGTTDLPRIPNSYQPSRTVGTDEGRDLPRASVRCWSGLENRERREGKQRTGPANGAGQAFRQNGERFSVPGPTILVLRDLQGRTPTRWSGPCDRRPRSFEPVLAHAFPRPLSASYLGVEWSVNE